MDVNYKIHIPHLSSNIIIALVKKYAHTSNSIGKNKE